jgi:hypothetical protein
MGARAMTLEQFYQICDALKPDECGCHNLPGRIPGRYHHIEINRKPLRATRLVLERKLGRPIKPGYAALHTCGWLSCINPEHLYEGIQKRDALIRNSRVMEGLKRSHDARTLYAVEKVLKKSTGNVKFPPRLSKWMKYVPPDKLEALFEKYGMKAPKL